MQLKIDIKANIFIFYNKAYYFTGVLFARQLGYRGYNLINFF